MNQITQAWLYQLDYIRDCKHVSPRGCKTHERLNAGFVINMNDPIINCKPRKLSKKFLLGECAWILNGYDDVNYIKRFNKKIENYSDNGKDFFGAYGPRFIAQVDYVVDSLVEDKYSRQAVLSLWREKSVDTQTKDTPCTLNIQWMIRDGELNCFVSMRSSDIWTGFIYDIFNFSAMSVFIQLALRERGEMDIPSLGWLYLTCNSSHFYVTDIDKHKTWNPISQSCYGPQFEPQFGADEYQALKNFFKYTYYTSSNDYVKAIELAAEMCLAEELYTKRVGGQTE